MARKVTKRTKTAKKTTKKAKINDAAAEAVLSATSTPVVAKNDSNAQGNKSCSGGPAVIKPSETEPNKTYIDLFPGPNEIDPLTFVWKHRAPPVNDPFRFPLTNDIPPVLYAVTSMKEMFFHIYDKVHANVASMYAGGAWEFPWQEHLHLSFYSLHFTTAELLSGRFNVAGQDAFFMASSWTESEKALARWVPVLYRDTTRPFHGDMWFAVLEDEPLVRQPGTWKGPFTKHEVTLFGSSNKSCDGVGSRRSSRLSGGRLSESNRSSGACSLYAAQCGTLPDNDDLPVRIGRCGANCG